MDGNSVKEMDQFIKRFTQKTEKKVGHRPEIFRASDNPDYGIVKVIPTGVRPIDKLIGGGIPIGMFTTISGPSESGKTTLAYRLIANFQKLGLGGVLFAANERRYDKTWAEKQGMDVNSEDLYFLNAKVLEDPLVSIVDLAKDPDSGIKLIVVDTISSLASYGEMKDSKGGDRDIYDNTIGLMARQLSQFFRLATAEVSDSGVSVVFLNQMRKDISGLFAKDMEPGGNAYHHMRSLGLWMRPGAGKNAPQKVVDGKLETAGFECVTKIVATSIGRGTYIGKEVHFPFFYDRGFDDSVYIIDEAIEKGIITGSGGHYTFKDTKVHGKAHLYTELADRLDEIEKELEESDAVSTEEDSQEDG